MADESWRVPTLVQELAAGKVEPPSQFVVREQNRPETGSLKFVTHMPEPLPVIDLSRLATADDEASKLRSALETWGLFLVTNHGIEVSLMDDLMAATRDFFKQPLQVKQEYSNFIGGKGFQQEGYGNDIVSSQDQILDWQDRIHLTMEPEDERNIAYWPKHPDSFRDLLQNYASKTKKARDNVLRAMGKILELGEDYFISHIGERASGVARFNYYPPCSRPDLVFGIRPHTDAGAVTVLLVDNNVEGLQVQKDGIWYTIPSKPHTLLINLGDSMEIMMNGVFKSPVHRVVTNVAKERLSLAMFYSVEGQKMLEPAAGLLSEERPAQYRKIKSLDYILGFREAFAKGQRLVDTLKI